MRELLFSTFLGRAGAFFLFGGQRGNACQAARRLVGPEDGEDGKPAVKKHPKKGISEADDGLFSPIDDFEVPAGEGKEVLAGMEKGPGGFADGSIEE